MNFLIENIKITKYAFIAKNNFVRHNQQYLKSLIIDKTIRLEFEKFVI